VQAFADGLRESGITSERDLSVLSRNLSRYHKHIPFLVELSRSNPLGWAILKDGLQGREASAPTHTRDPEPDGEDEAYVEWFFNNIDPEKPLGHLAVQFTSEAFNSRSRLIDTAEDMGHALRAVPFLRRLASGDQLVWAMISVGFEDLYENRNGPTST
jgi:hypothetical protein